jgi:PrtD family type I secretion system ABC transporter
VPLFRSSAPVIRDAFRQCMPALLWAAAFSAGANILYLTPTIYMMQVYDRVVPSANGGTLLLVSLIGIAGLVTLSLLDWLRGRLLVRINAKMERLLAPRILDAVVAKHDLSRLERTESIREFDTLRQTLTGGAMLALFDLPWAPIYVVVAFLVHPLLALMTLVAAGILLVLAWANERSTHEPLERANGAAAIAYAKQSQVSSYAAEVRAIGMREALTAKTADDRQEANRLQLEASFAAGTYGGLIKFFRLTFQSAALAMGAWLAIDGKISMGSIIAASVLLSRALSPIEQVVGAWKQFTRVRSAHDSLAHVLEGTGPATRTRLPALQGRIAAEAVTVRDASGLREVLHDISFAIEPGAVVGIAGLSGAGKSTLLRALAGAAPVAGGTVRYDGAAMADWEGEQLPRAIGYLPQDFVLFPGSIRDNISRFDAYLGKNGGEIDLRVIDAASAIGAHEMILRLPAGYDTVVGPGGVGLSAGQTQRIALARALYGNPRVLLLDEPNAHLDAEGAAMLIELVARSRAEGITTVIAAHSAELLAACDRLLLVAGGRLAEHSPEAIRRARAPQTVKA